MDSGSAMQNIMSGYWDTAGVGKIGSASQTLLGADVCKLCVSTAKAELLGCAALSTETCQRLKSARFHTGLSPCID
jgi:hypothetical protein